MSSSFILLEFMLQFTFKHVTFFRVYEHKRKQHSFFSGRSFR